MDLPNSASSALSSMMVFQKPKRQFTAYNFFFQQERQRLLASLPDNNKTTTNGSNAKAIIKVRRSKKHAHNKIGFADLGREIAARWKKLSPDEKKYYEELSAQDKIRHKREMALWEVHEKERIAMLIGERSRPVCQDNKQKMPATSDYTLSLQEGMNNTKQQETHIHSNATIFWSAMSPVSPEPMVVGSSQTDTRSPDINSFAGAGCGAPRSSAISLTALSSSSLMMEMAADPSPPVPPPLLKKGRTYSLTALLHQSERIVSSRSSSSPGSLRDDESLLLVCNTKNLWDKHMLDQLQNDMGDECTTLFLQVFRPTSM